MKQSLIAFAILCSIGAPRFAAASEIIPWQNLIDQAAQTFDDPYRDLSYDQLEAVAAVARLRAQLEREGEDTRDQLATEARLADTLEALAGAGIDADWLIEQRWVVAERRQKAASAGNPEMDGQTVRLSGFAVPAPPDPDGTAVAYLVPERGMCSHMPPPNPNQMVRVRLTDDWRPRMMHEPVHLTGTLSLSPSEQTIQVVDGPAAMRATFLMEVETVETFVQSNPKASQVGKTAWTQEIAERLRKAGAVKKQKD